MFGTSSGCLHGAPHVAIARHQVPARLAEARGVHTSCFIDLLVQSVDDVVEHTWPRLVAVAAYDSVCSSEFTGFFREESGVDAAVDDIGATRTRSFSNLIAPQSISRMYADANNVGGGNRFHIKRIERLVYNNRVAERGRGGCRQDVKPARSNDTRSK